MNTPICIWHTRRGRCVKFDGADAVEIEFGEYCILRLEGVPTLEEYLHLYPTQRRSTWQKPPNMNA